MERQNFGDQLVELFLRHWPLRLCLHVLVVMWLLAGLMHLATL